MHTEVRDRPSFANIHVTLQPGETIIGEASAMASMSSGIEMTTRLNGGFFGGLGRKFLGSESMFVNHFTCTQPDQHVVLTQALPGDIECIDLNDTTLFLQPGAYIASEPTVRLGLGVAGVSSFVGGEGFMKLTVGGRGKVWFGGYGGIFSREIDGEYIVDTGHLIAYEPTISLKVAMSGGIFSTFMGGEGLVTRVRGTGRVYLQTRALGGLAAWANSYL